MAKNPGKRRKILTQRNSDDCEGELTRYTAANWMISTESGDKTDAGNRSPKRGNKEQFDRDMRPAAYDLEDTRENQGSFVHCADKMREIGYFAVSNPGPPQLFHPGMFLEPPYGPQQETIPQHLVSNPGQPDPTAHWYAVQPQVMPHSGQFMPHTGHPGLPYLGHLGLPYLGQPGLPYLGQLGLPYLGQLASTYTLQHQVLHSGHPGSTYSQQPQVSNLGPVPLVLDPELDARRPEAEEARKNMKGNYKICPICQKKFFSIVDLLLHRKSHYSDHCRICDTRYKSHDNLLKHLVNHCGKKRKLKCQHCSVSFPCLKTFKEHTEQVIATSTGNMVQCPVCHFKKFAVNAVHQLRSHYARHGDEHYDRYLK